MPHLPKPFRRFLRTRTPGEQGERVAEKYLRKQGYKTLARNLRTRHGEIDLLMLAPDKRTLVFIEVKTARPDRTSTIPPEARVGLQKQRKIVSLASRLIAKYKLTGRPVRFDIVGVSLHHDRKPDIRHYPGAFGWPW